MIIFSKTLRFASVFNLSAGILLTIIGFCLKNAFKGGTTLNQIGFLFSIEAFGIIMILLMLNLTVLIISSNYIRSYK